MAESNERRESRSARNQPGRAAGKARRLRRAKDVSPERHRFIPDAEHAAPTTKVVL
jgi:hypothetical protein